MFFPFYFSVPQISSMAWTNLAWGRSNRQRHIAIGLTRRCGSLRFESHDAKRAQLNELTAFYPGHVAAGFDPNRTTTPSSQTNQFLMHVRGSRCPPAVEDGKRWLNLVFSATHSSALSAPCVDIGSSKIIDAFLEKSSKPDDGAIDMEKLASLMDLSHASSACTTTNLIDDPTEPRWKQIGRSKHCRPLPPCCQRMLSHLGFVKTQHLGGRLPAVYGVAGLSSPYTYNVPHTGTSYIVCRKMPL